MTVSLDAPNLRKELLAQLTSKRGWTTARFFKEVVSLDVQTKFSTVVYIGALVSFVETRKITNLSILNGIGIDTLSRATEHKLPQIVMSGETSIDAYFDTFRIEEMQENDVLWGLGPDDLPFVAFSAQIYEGKKKKKTAVAVAFYNMRANAMSCNQLARYFFTDSQHSVQPGDDLLRDFMRGEAMSRTLPAAETGDEKTPLLETIHFSK